MMAISMLPTKLTLEQQAKLNKLPGMLCISDIATLRYSTEKDLIEPYSFQIAEACLAGELEYMILRGMDWRWLCEHPEQKPMLEVTIDYESVPFPGSPEYENEQSCWCLESEWEGDPEPKPAYKYQDPLSKLKRFNVNNWNSSAFEVYRYEYATGRRCMISAENFKQWLISIKSFPLPNDCLLISWINVEPQTETVAFTSATNQGEEDSPKSKVNDIFSKFSGLRANEISILMMENKTAKMGIRGGKPITVSPDDLGLQADSIGWKLLESASLCEGELKNGLQRLNSTSNQESEKSRVKTNVSRLRTSLREKMGLINNPINYTEKSGYKFAFNSMTNELLNGKNVTKGADALDFPADEEFDDNQYDHNSFWKPDSDY